LRFRAARLGNYSLDISGMGAAFWPTLATTAALTWFNPHVYLDTLGLIGAVSTQYTALPEKIVFAVAAIAASFTFFFSLGFGARLLSPIMQTPLAWRLLDALIGLVMWAIAAGLILTMI